MQNVCLIFISAAFLFAMAQAEPSHGKVVICFGASNQLIAESDEDHPLLQETPLNLCTHFIAGTTKDFDPSDSVSIASEQEYKDLMNIKQKYPHLKILFPLQDFPKPKDRSKFINKAKIFLLRYGFNGLHLTFGFDDQVSLQANHFDTLMSNVKGMKESFEQLNLTLTSSIKFKETIPQGYNYSALCSYVDFVFPIQISYDSKNEAEDWLHISSLENRINNTIELGVPSSKMIIDVYFFGHKFGQNDAVAKGSIGYSEICELTLNDGASDWEKHYDNSSSLAFLRNKKKNAEIKEIVYQSTRSMANRVKLAMKLDLAGVMALSIPSDDFRGKCGIDETTFDDFDNPSSIPKSNYQTFSLLRTINSAIYIAQGKSVPMEVTGNVAAKHFSCNVHMITGLIVAMVSFFTSI